MTGAVAGTRPFHKIRTGVARTLLCKDERLRDKIDTQLAAIKAAPKLIRSSYRAPSVAYITTGE
jgi:hypothetical protein